MNQKLLEVLKKKDELIPDEHDGSYELMRETVKAYTHLDNLDEVDYHDLNTIYLMSVGTFKHKASTKKKLIKEDSHLKEEDKKHLVSVIEKINNDAAKGKYSNHDPAITKDVYFGMFGTGFFSYKNKTDEKSTKEFIKLCIEILNMEDDELIYKRAEKVFTKSYKGMTAASASMILHCLKPYTFPVLNSTIGSKNVFDELDIVLKRKGSIDTYIHNCRVIKKFRDENLPFKNYRILDMISWEIDKYLNNEKTDSHVKNNEENYINETPYTFEINITYEDWKNLIIQDDIFRDDDIDMLTIMIHAGGSLTGKELGLIHNKNYSSFNGLVAALSKRINDNIQIEVPKRDNGKTRWWAILFDGEYTDDDHFRWKIRPELEEAIRDVYPDKFKSDINYFWLNANSDVWSYHDIKIDEEANYEYYNENGNKRRIFSNFEKAKPGDKVFGYLTSPEKSIVALLEITRNENEVLYFKKIKDIENSVSYNDVKEIEGLNSMEFLKQLNGSLFKVEQNEAAVLLKMIESRNKDTQPILKTYNKQKFLEDVFIDEEEYDDLKSLVLRKKNIIIQGPPGVGKTYAAKRLALSIIGYKDESKVKSIQFHQSYSYEDFMMGYRPKEDKFSLEYGVFYNFCEEARKDKDNKYFFIIDEINRGNLSKIFGELLMLLEKDKREQEIHLAYGDIRFSVPENLYIIGTMNTADRSLAIIDYALRRRFSFFELEPAFGKECFKNFLNGLNMEEDLVNRIIGRVDNLNIQIEDSSNLGKGFKIGHSYFCDYDPDDENWYENVIKYEIKPLLEEYWFDDLEKAKEYIKTLIG